MAEDTITKNRTVTKVSFLAFRMVQCHKMHRSERPPPFRRLHFHFRQRTSSHRLFSAPPSFLGSFSLPLLREGRARGQGAALRRTRTLWASNYTPERIRRVETVIIDSLVGCRQRLVPDEVVELVQETPVAKFALCLGCRCETRGFPSSRSVVPGFLYAPVAKDMLCKEAWLDLRACHLTWSELVR